LEATNTAFDKRIIHLSRQTAAMEERDHLFMAEERHTWAGLHATLDPELEGEETAASC
jgi:hypothetical protein